jgi:hypothetical protein
MKIMKFSSTKKQIPGPDRITTYSVYYLSRKSRDRSSLTHSQPRQGGLKQIPMTEIQNSKQMAVDLI